MERTLYRRHRGVTRVERHVGRQRFTRLLILLPIKGVSDELDALRCW